MASSWPSCQSSGIEASADRRMLLRSSYVRSYVQKTSYSTRVHCICGAVLWCIRTVVVQKDKKYTDMKMNIAPQIGFASGTTAPQFMTRRFLCVIFCLRELWCSCAACAELWCSCAACAVLWCSSAHVCSILVSNNGVFI